VVVIGLVGGIGSGKSTVAAVLAELGAAVIHADLVGHEVYRAGTPGFAAVVREFGAEVVGSDGEIDRKRLGARVFETPGALERLNAIVHPLIRTEIARRIDALRRAGEVPAVVVEAAILLEAGWRSLVDRVWVVTARPEHVQARLEAQRGLSAAEVEARVARQMGDQERLRAAGAVIENHGSIDELRQQVSRLWLSSVAR
jgi:dephospho-CoA kinase